jgi:imidazolonepropionase
LAQYILLRGAKQVLTLHGPDGARRGSALKQLSGIQDGSVLICDGKVKSVGSTRRIENLKEARTALEIDVSGCVVMPGFIDPGLRTSSAPAEFQKRGPKKTREIFDENLELMRSCLQHGTLTVEMKVEEPGRCPAAVPLLRQLAKIGDNPIGMMRTWKVSQIPEFEDEFDEFLATLDVIRRRKLAHFVEIGPEVGASRFGGSIFEALRLATIPLKFDSSRCAAEDWVREPGGLMPASITHSTFISEDVARHCADSSQIAMFSPGSDIAEACGSGMRRVFDHGGAIALTSGYDARSARGYSMQIAIARAVALGGLSVEEAISAATVNAAYAIGQGSQTGTIQMGKRADIAVLAIPDYRELPRQFGINQVRQVLRQGQVVFNRGRWKIGAHAEDHRDGGMRTESLRRARSQAS